MTAAILSALASHWRRNPLPLLTLLVGLALSTALWSGVQAINAEARASYGAAAATLGEGQLAQITARDGRAIPQQTYVALRRAVEDRGQVHRRAHGRAVDADDLAEVVHAGHPVGPGQGCGGP